MDIIVCSITRKLNAKDTILYKSLQNINVEWYIETGNTKKGLGQFFNECINNYSSKEVIVFVHDDVEFISTDLDKQLSNAFKSFDVIGVAGCVNPKIIEKNLWHWMAQTKDNLRGIAGHPVSEENFYVTSFGPTPARAAIIDGVFMALKTRKIIETNTKFDEQFLFHHYDIDFSLTCNKNKVKIGVWPILINHQSPGLKEFDSKFQTSNENFIKKWKNI
jgi:glycosyltransferase involved in cell wall biosynthesis